MLLLRLAAATTAPWLRPMGMSGVASVLASSSTPRFSHSSADFDALKDGETLADKSVDDLKQRILTDALALVPKHGWSFEALAEASTMQGLPTVAHGLFTKGNVQLIEFFISQSNQDLSRHLKASLPLIQSLSQQERVRFAMYYRIKKVLPFAETWPQAMAIMAAPQNLPFNLHQVALMSDDICHYAGYSFTDLRWYTYRASIGAIHKATEIFMIQDKSQDFADTLQFLDRRIEDLFALSQIAGDLHGAVTTLINNAPIKPLAITLQNLLGFQQQNR